MSVSTAFVRRWGRRSGALEEGWSWEERGDLVVRERVGWDNRDRVGEGDVTFELCLRDKI